MTVTRKVRRPPSKLASRKQAIAKALPRGLPKEVARFYAAGDGLEVTLGGDVKETARLVGLAQMFDGGAKGDFRAHAPVKKAAELYEDDFEWLGRPFYERFFNEHLEVGSPKELKRLNLLLRLKLLVSIEGESAYLAIDFFDGAPTLYFVNELAPFKLALTFDELVTHFSLFGARRWYFAFLDKAAEKELNINLRAELEASLKDFDPDEVAPLLARFPKARAVKAPAPVVTAEAPLGMVERWAAEAKESLSDRNESLHYLTLPKEPAVWDAFAEAVERGAVSLEAVWGITGAVEHLPAKLFPALVVARRYPKQDRLWPRLVQLSPRFLEAVKENPGAFAKLKLDPFMRDVMEVVRLLLGLQPAGTAGPTVSRAIAEWPFEPPFGRDRAGLNELATALVGLDKAIAIARSGLDANWKSKRWRDLSAAGVLFLAPTFELKDLIGLTGSYCNTDVLVTIAKERGWTKAQVKAMAEASKHGYYEKKHVGEAVPKGLSELAARL